MTAERDQWGHHLAASALLDEHHDVVGVSDFGDDIADSCEVCGFAVGFCEPDDGPDYFGHATQCHVDEVRDWIANAPLAANIGADS
jgi:hypothetical protein